MRIGRSTPVRLTHAARSRYPVAMKLLLLTYGTEGDTRPLAALGQALMEAGHQVELLADASTLGVAESLGLPSGVLAGDIRATIASEGAMPDMARNLGELAKRHSGEWMRQALHHGRGCDAIVVSGLAAFIGLSAAEALRVPAIGSMLIPITPTRAFATPFLPFAPPRLLNRPSHHLFNQLTWQLLRKATNRARVEAGLPPRTSLWTDHPMLYGISQALVPRPDDWPDNAHVCGQWVPRLPAAAWSPDPALVAFLEAGEAPIYVGFGSMAGFDDMRLLDAVVGAVGPRRALFSAGWSGIDSARLPPNFHLVGHVPHDWLLPRTSMAIHHGGSGTTHSACAAGVPSIVVPFAGDQFFWGRRLTASGVMQHALKGATITAPMLAQAIAHAGSGGARQAAARLGRQMQGEDGAASGVALVERYAAGGEGPGA